MEMSGEFRVHAASSQSEKPLLPIEHEAVWTPRSGLDVLEERRMSLSLPGTEPLFVCCSVPL